MLQGLEGDSSEMQLILSKLISDDNIAMEMIFETGWRIRIQFSMITKFNDYGSEKEDEIREMKSDKIRADAELDLAPSRRNCSI